MKKFIHWKSISNLLGLYKRKLRPKEGQQDAWYIWNWDDVVVPLLLVINEYFLMPIAY